MRPTATADSTRTHDSTGHVRLGCCLNMIAPPDDFLGRRLLPGLARLGFEYAELSLRDMAALTPDRLADLAARLEATGLRCEACNNFFPADIRLTGPNVDRTRVLAYAGRALDCAHRLGARVVVFGCGAARLVPDGFPMADAWRQVAACLADIAPGAEQRSITIAIETLNRQESNIVTCLAEGLALVREVAHPAVRLLLDTYHAEVEGDDAGVVDRAARDIGHVHAAAGRQRRFPSARSAGLSALIGPLAASGCRGRCSIEAYTSHLEADAPLALDALREMFAS